MLSALRNDRDDMIKSLKRPVQNQALVGMKSKSVTGEETDETAEMNNAQLLQMQRALMEEQDEALGHLEQSVNTTKHVASMFKSYRLTASPCMPTMKINMI